jgi:hypothetical protein
MALGQLSPLMPQERRLWRDSHSYGRSCPPPLGSCPAKIDLIAPK